MSEDEEQEAAETGDEHAGDHENGGHGAEPDGTERDRVTSPMQDYSMGQVTTGFVVLLVGVGVAYALPSLL